MDAKLKDRINDELIASLHTLIERICDSSYEMTESEISALPVLVHALQEQLKCIPMDGYRPMKLRELLTSEEIPRL